MKQGLVIKSTGSWYAVKDENGNIIECKIKGKIRLKGIRTTNPVVVGDIVNFEINDTDNVGVISKICDRKNQIERKSTNLSKHSQIIASNIDQIFLVVTINYPQTTTMFIDRFLVSAEVYDIPVNIVFNKVDLYNEKDNELLEDYLDIYDSAGYNCIQVSATEEFNLEEIKNLLKDKISVFSGHSGVGKSTLINAIDSNLDLKTGEISESHLQGKHTTTFSEMFEINTGGYLIDTPGIRGFGIIDIEKSEIFHFFPEIFNYSQNCKFHNCTHIHEPKCAVINAVENGEIHPSRYNNYVNIVLDEEEKHRL